MTTKLTETGLTLMIKEFLAEKNVPHAVIVAKEKLCNMYQFDNIYSYVKLRDNNEFVQTFTFTLDEPFQNLLDEQNISLDNDSFHRHAGKDNGSNPVVNYMLIEKFFKMEELSKSAPYLKEINFPPPGVEVSEDSEIYIFGLGGQDTGIMGYAAFVRGGTHPPLSNQAINDITNMCCLINSRVEINEINKRLAVEEHLSTTDSLTGLPVFEKFKNSSRRLVRQNPNYLLFFLDIDKFKYINDIWSFKKGDEILKEIANMLADYVCDDELCCRLSDDKFLMLLKYDTVESIQIYIDDLNQKFVDIQKNQFENIKITIICGVFIVQPDMDFNLMVDKANIARRMVKGSYNNAFEIYSQDLENLSEKEKQLEHSTMVALKNDEFLPFLQPKFNVKTMEICGAEALARWITPERMIAPYEFIPIFEKNGFITKLDFVIYEKTFAFIRKCLDQGKKVYPISLNVSRGHINDSTFHSRLTQLIKKYQIPNDVLEFEITESMFAEDKEQLLNFIKTLRTQGMKVSIDDFGTAYSSLTLLKDISVDTIKLDKAFIDNITDVKVDQDGSLPVTVLSLKTSLIWCVTCVCPLSLKV